MNLKYKRATLEDIDILTETRIEVLRAANKLSADTDMSEVERQSYNYYQKALCDGSHIAYLFFDGNRFVGAGGVSFFQVMPTYHNPNGNKAYIMNMYTSSKTLFGSFFEIDQHNNKTFNAICCSKNHMTDSCGLPSFL